jgi:hypothetical protein
MDFFEGLERAWGSEGFAWFRERLFEYVGPYKFMLRETCKRFYFKRNADEGDFYAEVWALQEDCRLCGHVNILDYMVNNEWDMVPDRDYPKTSHLSIVKWGEKNPHLLCLKELMQDACENGYLDIVEYGLKKQFDFSNCYAYAENIQVLDLLMSHKVPVSEPLHFSGIGTEEKLCWVLAHDHFKEFNFYEEKDFDDLVRFIEHANRMEWKNKNLLTHVYDLFKWPRKFWKNWKYPQGKCALLSDTIARTLDSSRCECGDPANHERRKRIKN